MQAAYAQSCYIKWHSISTLPTASPVYLKSSLIVPNLLIVPNTYNIYRCYRIMVGTFLLLIIFKPKLVILCPSILLESGDNSIVLD